MAARTASTSYKDTLPVEVIAIALKAAIVPKAWEVHFQFESDLP